MKRVLPNSVVRAKKLLDHERLSQLGKLGNVVKQARRKRKEALKLYYALQLNLFGAEENAKQANEHICPVD